MANPTLLLGIGAQKSGTTWMYDYLSNHPDCHFRPIKELHYFNAICGDIPMPVHEKRIQRFEELAARQKRDWYRHPVRYLKTRKRVATLRDYTAIRPGEDGDHSDYFNFLCEGRGARKVVVDITPVYMALDGHRYEEMLEITEDVRFLLMLRDPADRLWSQIRMDAGNVVGQGEEFEAKALKMVDRFLKGNKENANLRSDYAAALDNLFHTIPEDKRHVIFYENLFRSEHGAETLRGVTDFIGIAPKDGALGKQVFTGKSLKLDEDRLTRVIRELQPQYEFCNRFFEGRIPERWKQNMARIEAT